MEFIILNESFDIANSTNSEDRLVSWLLYPGSVEVVKSEK